MSNTGYFDLNARLGLGGEEIDFDSDKEAVRQYFRDHVNQNMVFFHSLEEKLDFLFKEGYYVKEIFDEYPFKFVKSIYKKAYAKKYRFRTFMGAFKFYTSYALKTLDGERYLERYEDRVVAVALTLGRGDQDLALALMEEIISNRYQPATPTFLNSARARGGEPVSCFPAGTLVEVEDGLSVAIETIREGDMVRTEDGKLNRVIGLNKRIYKDRLVNIRVCGSDVIRTTTEHPFLVSVAEDDRREAVHAYEGTIPGVRWIRAVDLVAEDKVICIDEEGTFDGVVISVSVEAKDFNDFVYNIQVENNPTYVVNSVIVHNCFLLRTLDNMEAIGRTINSALQLSKRGGGVGILLTDIRETGAPIKGFKNQSSGIIPVMKLLEDSFTYANQLGARQGAGAVYLNVHHMDIMKFLDTKRENADEKIRIKTMSLGLVVPDITVRLAAKNEPMYLFSSYDVQRVYGKPMSDVDITAEYYNMVDNPEITKSKISARKLFETIAEIQMESGYPYILYEDIATRANVNNGKIVMSNLCIDGNATVEISSDPNGRNVSTLDFFALAEVLKAGLHQHLWVKTWDDGTVVWKELQGVHGKGEVDELIEIEFEGQTLRVTEGHRMFTKNRGWVEAQDLLEDDILVLDAA